MKIMFGCSGFELLLALKNNKQKQSFHNYYEAKIINLCTDNGMESHVELMAWQQIIKNTLVNAFFCQQFTLLILLNGTNILYIIINRWTSLAAVCCCHNKFCIHIVKYFYENVLPYLANVCGDEYKDTAELCIFSGNHS